MIDVLPAVLATDDETIDIVGKMVKCHRAEVGIHLRRGSLDGRGCFGLKGLPAVQFFHRRL